MISLLTFIFLSLLSLLLVELLLVSPPLAIQRVTLVVPLQHFLVMKNCCLLQGVCKPRDEFKVLQSCSVIPFLGCTQASTKQFLIRNYHQSTISCRQVVQLAPLRLPRHSEKLSLLEMEIVLKLLHERH